MEADKTTSPPDPEATSEGELPPQIEAAWGDNDSDPAYPRNFTRTKKWTVITVLSVASFGV